MRIIAGEYRSRRLEAPAGLATRPTSDRLRETLFNVLAARIGGARFLDLYAGSGAVGLEALSRGAARVTFVERAPVALKVLWRNLEQLGIESGFDVRAESVAVMRSSRPIASQRIDALRKTPCSRSVSAAWTSCTESQTENVWIGMSSDGVEGRS